VLENSCTILKTEFLQNNLFLYATFQIDSIFAQNQLMTKRIITIFLICSLPLSLLCDSPITNTPFYKAYLDFKMVEKAELKGYLDQEITDYLLSPKISLDLKAAIINALSFEILGTDNAERFIRFLNIKYHSEDFVEYQDRLSAHELFCLGYLYAMDDYFQPEIALPYFNKAQIKDPNNYSINMLQAVTIAQSLFKIDKCKAWKLVEVVINNAELYERMLPEAEEIIITYFKHLEQDCK